MKLPYPFSASALMILLATMAQAQVVNGSFEADQSGFPVSGWGGGYVSDFPDDLFPTDGNKYMVVESGRTGPTVASHGPHGFSNVGSSSQVVTRPAGEFCSLTMDWEFLPGENLPGILNDFLSIDVINQVTNILITNVVFIDTGLLAGTPAYTNVPGAGGGGLTWVPNQSIVWPGTTGMQAPAGPKRATVDLSAVAAGTLMRIEISVGNVGDSEGPSRAYIDRVVLSGGQRNFNAGSAGLRVLCSASSDGQGPTGNNDWSDDALLVPPYTFRTCPGQHLSFRANGVAGLGWFMIAGSLVDPGLVTPFGQVNVDIFVNPFTIPINAMMSNPTNWYDADIPELVPIGTRITVQGAMSQPGGALALSAATTLDIGVPRIPIGGATVGGGAVSDNGSTNQAFVAFGGGTWPFFGAPRSSVDVNSNGSVSFGGGDASSAESESGMRTGPARIAPVWDDFLPQAGGHVRSKQTAQTYTVSWTNLAESATGLHGNNFSVQLYQGVGSTPAGVFTIYYTSTTMSDGLTGISPGGLPAPSPNSSNVNWTSMAASGGARGIIPPGVAIYERFALADNGQLRDTFDLMSIGGLSRITFVPDGIGGYTYFVGTR